MITNFFNFQSLNEAKTPKFTFDRVNTTQSILGEPITFEIVERIYNADPTRDKLYVYWIISLFKQKSERVFLEDLYRVTHALTIFDRVKRSLPERQRNIFNYKSINDLEAITDQFQDETPVSNRERKGKGTPVENEYEVLFENDDYMIILPKTYRASCWWGKGTKWCTAFTENDRYYKDYSEQGQLYIIYDKKQERSLYQFHFETGQYMDVNDIRIDIDEFFRKNPGLEIPIRKDRIKRMEKSQNIEGLVNAIVNDRIEDIDLQISIGALNYAWDYKRYGDNILTLCAKQKSSTFIHFVSVLPDELLSNLLQEKTLDGRNAICFFLRGINLDRYKTDYDLNEKVEYTLERCVKFGLNVNDEFNDGYTLLHEACQYKLPFAVEILMKVGANPNLQFEKSNNETAFMNLLTDRKQIDEDTVKIAKLLLEYNYNPNLQDNDGKSTLQYVIFMLSKDKTKNDIIEIIIDMLLQAGGDLNLPDSSGNTPMHTYAVTQNGKLLQKLIDNGGDIHKKRNDGKSPLDISKIFGSKEFKNIGN